MTTAPDDFVDDSCPTCGGNGCPDCQGDPETTDLTSTAMEASA